VIACAGSATAEVDVDAGTHVVSQEEIKKVLSIVPPTRVDPAVQRTSTAQPTLVAEKATPAGRKYGRAGRRPEGEGTRRLPIGAIAAGVAALAIGGGLFAFKDKLGAGSGQISPGTKTDSTAAPSTTAGPNVVPPRARDTTARVVPGPVQKPAGRQTEQRDSLKAIGTNPTPMVPVRTSKVSAALPSLDAVLEVSTRSRARDEATIVYNRTDVLDSIRAEAASLVGQAFNEDGNFEEAKRWFGKAQQLFPRELYQKLITDADRNLRRSAPN
jgi:hypothetical protein